MSDTRLASCQTLVSGADMLGQHTNGPQDVKPADIDELIRVQQEKLAALRKELQECGEPPGESEVLLA